MKFLIDLTSISPNNTGIEYVAQNAALSFINACCEKRIVSKNNQTSANCKQDIFLNINNNHVVLLFNNHIPKAFKQLKEKYRVTFIDLKTNNWDYLRFIKLPKAIKDEKADINLFFAFPCPYFASHKNSVSLIHDLTAFNYASTQTFWQNYRWKKMIKKCIKRDKHILTVSDTIKYEIANVFCRGDAKRIYPGIKKPSLENTSILEKNKLKAKEYILAVGTLEPRKNFKLLIKAYNNLLHTINIKEKLVIVGKSGWKESFRNTKNIIFLDYKNDEDLSTLYKNAKLFVQPSVYEGFGLPVIEAASHGIKILTSDISVFKETTGGNAVFFKNNDSSDLQQKLTDCLKDNVVSQKINLKKFNWEKYGEILYEFLVLKKKCLTINTNNLQINSGSTVRTRQCFKGLSSKYNVDNYVGCSNVNYYIMNCMDVLRALFKKNCSLKNRDFKWIKRVANSKSYSTIFIDSSLYGNVYKKLKKKFPQIEIITHFHNCEEKFYKDMFQFHKKTNINLMSCLTLWMVKKSEKKAVKYSDKLIFISDVDRDFFVKKYNISKNKTYIIPPCIPDKYHNSQFKDNNDFVMFVGSGFYANVEALNFISNKLCKNINKKVVILGDESLCKNNGINQIEIKKYDENYYEVFENASAFISPIFSGSGSKIKIAEALMWGKTIIATKDSLIGYDIKDADVIVCNTPQEFIKTINNCKNEPFSLKNRKLYLEKYSIEANKKYFQSI